ncbi:MAG TPA: Sir2 family NAD-dependent protein deacetylase, partial [Burkholderiaceae bacterium]|nr:Sir2 family NAD-dependent protein deacetylase [Burkholderiaceae bacterium]
AQARRVAVLTGAGISAESGIPTFRDASSGLWAKFDPVKLASEEGFRAVHRWYGAGTRGGAVWSVRRSRTLDTLRWLQHNRASMPSK